MTLTELCDQWEWIEMSVRYDLRKDGALELLAEDMLKRSAQGKTTIVQFVEHGEEIEPERPKRTNKQNAALHQYCRMLAKALNDAGFDMKRTLKADAEIPWGEWNAKEMLWRPIQKAMYGIESTSDIDTLQCQEVYKVLDRHLGSKTGVTVPWPSRESLMHESYQRQNRS